MWVCIILVSQLLVMAHQAPAGAPRPPQYQLCEHCMAFGIQTCPAMRKNILLPRMPGPNEPFQVVQGNTIHGNIDYLLQLHQEQQREERRARLTGRAPRNPRRPNQDDDGLEDTLSSTNPEANEQQDREYRDNLREALHNMDANGLLNRMTNQDDLPQTNFGYPNQIGGTGALAQAYLGFPHQGNIGGTLQPYLAPPPQSFPAQGKFGAVPQGSPDYPQHGTRVTGPLLSDAFFQGQFQPSPEEVESYQRQMILEHEFQDRPEILQAIRDAFHRARLQEQNKAHMQANPALREEIRRQREAYERQQAAIEAEQEEMLRRSQALLRGMEFERNERMGIAPAPKDLDEGGDANYDETDRRDPAVRSEFSDHRARGRNPNASRRTSRFRSQRAESRLREEDQPAAGDQENPVVQDEPMGEENQDGRRNQFALVEETQGCPVDGRVRRADMETSREGQEGADENSPSSSPRERDTPEETSSPGSGRRDPEKRPADEDTEHQGASRRRRVNG